MYYDDEKWRKELCKRAGFVSIDRTIIATF